MKESSSFARSDPTETHRERKTKERRYARRKKIFKKPVISRHVERCISRSPNMRARVERQTDETFRQQFEKLYRENQPKIFRVAYGVTGKREDAQDVVQNVFVKLMEVQPSPDFIKDPPRYLCRAAIHEAVSMFRSRQREKLAEEDVSEIDVPVAAGIWGGDGDSERLEELDQGLKVAREQLD